MAWVPLESNPEVMTKLLHKLGVPKQWGLVDVYSLDLDMLEMLPKPVLAMILLYPMTPKSESFKIELEKTEKESGSGSDKIYHLAQYVSNACGTIALLHSVANKLDKIELEDGELKKFIDDTKDLTSEKRGEKLVEAQGISVTHEDSAHEGQTEAPGEDEKVFHHFVAFVERNGSIWELGKLTNSRCKIRLNIIVYDEIKSEHVISDGRKPYPINHGPSNTETFLEDAARVCKEYMSRDPEEVGFTIMALAALE
ncbi:ubiquitin carboxyl-terminal hydrolase isozyme L3 isoform X1 [Phymastichus coffea]|uniref:ubiquitin carboxyl-terminal hydrolase isozyme L3 isoform X1 n=1 Tax=Phymastichus coffea TaxID=108790 RepID=UPI00273B08C9|nr:ubiquitin carboxyl-terminal hydrolase isozyme L3 isoform X1 [Phymastichus coffea]XP_058790610.1 ubiquitin carboxyl-terminal hydrolase isozyme L3 isoform X1 [Phymastichus coffea]XP_058790611.1 ubiquitin carboxyl-terminal hydrolase isozyme L3 isoform X1 [Phymastichus coffea]